MEWEDDKLGRVRVSTASVQAGAGNQPNLTAFSLSVESDYPGDWVCKLVPTGGLPDSTFGVLEVIEGSVGSQLRRLMPFGALGVTLQLRGMNLSVRVGASAGEAQVIGCSVAPGVVQTRWTLAGGALLAGGGGDGVDLPQLTSVVRVACSGAPATGLTVRQVTPSNVLIAEYNLLPNESLEIPLAIDCVRISLVNPDVVNPVYGTVSALVTE